MTTKWRWSVQALKLAGGLPGWPRADSGTRGGAMTRGAEPYVCHLCRKQGKLGDAGVLCGALKPDCLPFVICCACEIEFKVASPGRRAELLVIIRRTTENLALEPTT